MTLSYTGLPRADYNTPILGDSAFDEFRDRITRMLPGVDPRTITAFNILDAVCQHDDGIDIAAATCHHVTKHHFANIHITNHIYVLMNSILNRQLDPTYYAYRDNGCNVYDRKISPVMIPKCISKMAGLTYREAIHKSLSAGAYRETALLYLEAEQQIGSVDMYEASIRDGSLDVVVMVMNMGKTKPPPAAPTTAPTTAPTVAPTVAPPSALPSRVTIEVPEGYDVDEFRELATRFASVAALKRRQPVSVLRDMVSGKIDPVIVRQFLEDDEIDPEYTRGSYSILCGYYGVGVRVPQPAHAIIGMLLGLPKAIIAKPSDYAPVLDIYTRYPDVSKREVASLLRAHPYPPAVMLAFLVCPDDVHIENLTFDMQNARDLAGLLN